MNRAAANATGDWIVLAVPVDTTLPPTVNVPAPFSVAPVVRPFRMRPPTVSEVDTARVVPGLTVVRLAAGIAAAAPVVKVPAVMKV